MATIKTQLEPAVKAELQTFTQAKKLVEKRKALIQKFLAADPSDVEAMKQLQAEFREVEG